MVQDLQPVIKHKLKKMKKVILLFAFVAVSQVGFSQTKASKEDALKVISASGSGGMMNAIKSQVLAMIPEDKKAAFITEFDGIIAKVNGKTADIYVEEYSADDIKAMLAFYESPVGKKMASKSEAIMKKSQESMGELQNEIQEVVMKYAQ